MHYKLKKIRICLSNCWLSPTVTLKCTLLHINSYWRGLKSENRLWCKSEKIINTNFVSGGWMGGWIYWWMKSRPGLRDCWHRQKHISYKNGTSGAQFRFMLLFPNKLSWPWHTIKEICCFVCLFNILDFCGWFRGVLKTPWLSSIGNYALKIHYGHTGCWWHILDSHSFMRESGGVYIIRRNKSLKVLINSNKLLYVSGLNMMEGMLNKDQWLRFPPKPYDAKISSKYNLE